MLKGLKVTLVHKVLKVLLQVLRGLLVLKELLVHKVLKVLVVLLVF